MSDPVSSTAALVKGTKKAVETIVPEPPEMPELPDIPEPTVIPLAEDEAAKRAKRRSLMRQRARGGRASTILSAADKLG